MIVVMRAGYTPDDFEEIKGRLIELGYQVNPIVGVEKTILAAVGGSEHTKFDMLDQLKAYDFVEDVIFITKPYKVVAREYKKERTVIDVRGVPVGGDEVVMMAGPCTVESEEQLDMTARAVARGGARILRGGAYKPSTSPYSFQGMGVPGLKLLRETADRYNLAVVTEIMDVRKVELVSEYADLLQVGTRNMQNYDLLKEVGMARRPILLKRGMSAKIEEWLLAAEYIASSGNENIILCERGVRTFETSTRNTLDISAVPSVKSLSHLPIIVDPSQGTGKRDLVPPMCRAAIAAGADGLIVEVHPNPDHAIKDGAQSMTIEAYEQMMPELAKVSEAVGRSMAQPAAVS